MISHGWKKIVVSVLLAGFFLSVLLLSGFAGYQQGTLSGNVLRLHIIGNTNSESDQTLKLLVRDSILREYKDIFSHAVNAEDATIRAGLATTNMRKTAEQTLRQHGCFAPVSVQLEETSFPTKNYGSVSLPAGKYTAVNIRIGDAEGKNWWCVLYPPLCLTEGTVQAEKETLKLLKENLSPNDFATVTQSENITFKMRFKLLELFGNFFS